MKKLPQSQRYSYVFEGNSQVLDHILVANHLLDPYYSLYDVVHVNAEFANQASRPRPAGRLHPGARAVTDAADLRPKREKEKE